MEDLLNDFDKIKERVHWYDSHLRMVQNAHEAKSIELETTRLQLATLTKAWSDDRERMVQLEQHICDLKEENAAFSKVSQIIAMEKENARLRNEINLLQKKFHKEVEVVQVVIVPESEPQHEEVEKEAEAEVEKEESFLLKKIKGKLYYVSESDKQIYECLADEEIGERVGRLIVKNGKLVPEFC